MAIGVLAVASTAWAELIVLKDGRTVRGEVVSQTEKDIKVKVQRYGVTATRSFRRAEIASIRKDAEAGDATGGQMKSAAGRTKVAKRQKSAKKRLKPAGALVGDRHRGSRCVVKSPRVMPANPRVVAKTGHGRLAMVGRGDEQIRLVTVWGTPFERGRAQGELLRKEVASHTGRFIELMTKDMKQPVEALDKVYAATKPHTPAHFVEELKGLAEGSGTSLQQITRANLIGEASEWHCSLFGAWGKATRADGHVYQLRALDYAVRSEIQRHPAIIVHVPDKGHPFANIGWAGVVGAVSGISSAAIALSEIGDNYDKDNDTFDGQPFMYMLRDILQFDRTLEAAIERVRRTPRTTSLMYAIGDGKFGQVRALQTSHTLCNVYDPSDLEPLTDAHRRIPDVVYWGMSWDVPKYDGPLHDKLVEHYGRIDAKVTIEDILPSVGTGNLQAVVYDLTALRIWVANARAKGENGPLEAYKRPFVEIDMKQAFDQASRLAADKAL